MVDDVLVYFVFLDVCFLAGRSLSLRKRAV